MRNAYAGVCFWCNKMVGAGKGGFERVTEQHKHRYQGVYKDRAWVVYHNECETLRRKRIEDGRMEAKA